MASHPAPAALHTPLCELLGIRYPIVQAPMAGGWTNPELVAAVSEAGGLGGLGAARHTPEQLRAAIRAIRERTDRPFAVNLLLAPSEPGPGDVEGNRRVLDGFREALGLAPTPKEISPPAPLFPALLEVIFEERAPVFSVGLGDPTPLVHRAHAAGMKVMAMVTTVAEAEQVVAGGVDAIVAQGAEAGGHRSTFKLGPGGEVPLVGTLPLVAQVTRAVAVPVVAAGGISDGRGLVAALALGAAGVQLGTRFLLARESGAYEGYRHRLLEGRETDTVLTRAFSGRPARGLRNRFVEGYEQAGVEPLPWPLQGVLADEVVRTAMQRGESDYTPLFAGQALRGMKDGQGAAEIVAELVAEATAVLARLGL